MSEPQAEENPSNRASPEQYAQESRKLQRQLARSLLRSRNDRAYRDLIRAAVPRTDLSLGERIADRLLAIGRALVGRNRVVGDRERIPAELQIFQNLVARGKYRSLGTHVESLAQRAMSAGIPPTSAYGQALDDAVRRLPAPENLQPAPPTAQAPVPEALESWVGRDFETAFREKAVTRDWVPSAIEEHERTLLALAMNDPVSRQDLLKSVPALALSPEAGNVLDAIGRLDRAKRAERRRPPGRIVAAEIKAELIQFDIAQPDFASLDKLGKRRVTRPEAQLALDAIYDDFERENLEAQVTAARESALGTAAAIENLADVSENDLDAVHAKASQMAAYTQSQLAGQQPAPGTAPDQTQITQDLGLGPEHQELQQKFDLLLLTEYVNGQSDPDVAFMNAYRRLDADEQNLIIGGQPAPQGAAPQTVAPQSAAPQGAAPQGAPAPAAPPQGVGTPIFDQLMEQARAGAVGGVSGSMFDEAAAQAQGQSNPVKPKLPPVQPPAFLAPEPQRKAKAAAEAALPDSGPKIEVKTTVLPDGSTRRSVYRPAGPPSARPNQPGQKQGQQR